MDANGSLPTSENSPHPCERESGEASLLGRWHADLLTVQQGCVARLLSLAACEKFRAFSGR